MTTHFNVLVIGGGNAGISVSALLLRKRKSLSVGIIEPNSKHYYQPAWTLVGGGVFDINKTQRNEADVIPKGAIWIKATVAKIDPGQKHVITSSGDVYHYDYVIICPGIQIDWGAIKGFREALGTHGVCSNYSFGFAPYTFECIKNFRGGKALFHSPPTKIKCGGAPYKIMYLAADYFRKHGLSSKADIQFWSGGTRLFAIEKYEKTLAKVVERYGIRLNFFQRLEEIDGANKRARFLGIGAHNKDAETWLDYEFIHVTPPQSAPDFLKQSPLADNDGWVSVDKYTLQHVKYPNVFSLGDASNLPTSKTGAAIRKQTPVLVENLLSHMDGKPLTARYTGYTSCPIVTGYGKLVLAEFDYNNNPMETFPFDQSKERWSMYQLKKHVLPRLYWNAILKGRMQG